MKPTFQQRGNYTTVESYVKAHVGELNPDLSGAYPKLKDAEQLFLRAVNRKDRIAIYGDYDCDGVTSLSIFKRLCDALKVPVLLIAPGRFADGYGINESRVETLIASGVQTILTVDNGIAAFPALQRAKEAGLTVIVLDHHAQVGDSLPDADVICDPHVTGGDDKHDFDDLCGAGLSYLFAKDIIETAAPSKKDVIDECLVLAMLGTVADVVTLRYDNRYIVQQGLKLMHRGICPAGLAGIFDILAVDAKSVTEEDIAWKIAPLINAAGRMANKGASVMVEILSADKAEDVQKRIEQAVHANELRKELCDNMFWRAKLYVKSLGTVPSFIVYVDNSKETAGIAGIVASKIAETYRVPALVLTKKGDIYKGSGRTYDTIDLLETLVQAKTEVPSLQFGGHAGACGASVPCADIDLLRKVLSDITPKSPDHELNTFWYDLNVPAKKLPDVLVDEWALGPFGAGCPLPVLHTKLHAVKDIEMGNGRHVKFLTKEGIDVVFWDGATNDECTAFRNSSRKVLDVVGSLSENEWQGNRRLQFTVSAMQ